MAVQDNLDPRDLEALQVLREKLVRLEVPDVPDHQDHLDLAEHRGSPDQEAQPGKTDKLDQTVRPVQ